MLKYMLIPMATSQAHTAHNVQSTEAALFLEEEQEQELFKVYSLGAQLASLHDQDNFCNDGYTLLPI